MGVVSKQLREPAGVILAAFEWFGAAISEADAADICKKWNKYSRRDWVTSVVPLIWLKNRILERRIGLPVVPYDGSTEVHFSCLIHIFDIYGTIGEGWGDDRSVAFAAHWVRSRITTTSLAIHPIDITAGRISELAFRRCRGCGKTFRTDVGYDLHVEECEFC